MGLSTAPQRPGTLQCAIICRNPSKVEEEVEAKGLLSLLFYLRRAYRINCGELQKSCLKGRALFETQP